MPDRTAIVGHEMRNALAVVSSATDLLLAHGLSAEDRHLVELVRLAGAQALAVADDLVAEAGLGADRFRVVPAPFDPAATVHAVAALWSPQVSTIGGRLAVDVAEGTPATIVGDESRVRQILFNLVSNALKAAGSGMVRLAIGPVEEGLAITVADDGPGLGAGFADTPFADAPAPMPGAGLGLWISCRVADAIGGRLTVEDAAGGGALARLTLPRTIGASPARPAPAARTASAARASRPRLGAAEGAAPRSPLAGLTVLVVDDNAVSRLLMKTILDSFDMAVETATGGDQALERVHLRRPDLVILDWSLARETGAEVFDRLLAALGPAMPPVISVSADPRPLHGPRVALHVVKPFTPRELHRALEAALVGARESAAAG